MPYSREWDEATPPGTGAAADIDTFIQNVKIDLRERIEQIIPGWGDETEDPKRAVIQVGDLVDRPAVVDAHKGELYFAWDEDEETLYLFDGTEWVALVTLGGEGDVGHPAFPMLKAAKTTTEQTFDSKTGAQAIEFDGADIIYEENAEFFDANESRTEFNITEDGKYLITASLALTHNADEDLICVMLLRINGSTLREDQEVKGTTPVIMNVSVVMELSAGDLVSLHGSATQANGPTEMNVGLFRQATAIEITRIA